MADTIHELGPNRWVVPHSHSGLFAIVTYDVMAHHAFAWRCTCLEGQRITAMNSQRYPDPMRCDHVAAVWELERVGS